MIYFIECADRVKIGYSANPKRRFDKLVTAMPFAPKILGVSYGDKDEERRLHREFSSYRKVGEWFEKNDKLSSLIKEISIRSVGVDEGDFRDVVVTVSSGMSKSLKDWRSTEQITAEEAAKRVGVTVAMWSRFETGSRRVPAERVIEFEGVTGVSRHDLRPDVFGEAPATEAAE